MHDACSFKEQLRIKCTGILLVYKLRDQPDCDCYKSDQILKQNYNVLPKVSLSITQIFAYLCTNCKRIKFKQLYKCVIIKQPIVMIFFVCIYSNVLYHYKIIVTKQRVAQHDTNTTLRGCPQSRPPIYYFAKQFLVIYTMNVMGYFYIFVRYHNHTNLRNYMLLYKSYCYFCISANCKC